MDEVQVLKNENEYLKNKVIELEEKLKKYTAPARSKIYYENHKDELLEKMKKYKQTPEQIKEIYNQITRIDNEENKDLLEISYLFYDNFEFNL